MFCSRLTTFIYEAYTDTSKHDLKRTPFAVSGLQKQFAQTLSSLRRKKKKKERILLDLCFNARVENDNQTITSASTMLTKKAAYFLKRNFIMPSRIVQNKRLRHVYTPTHVMF